MVAGVVAHAKDKPKASAGAVGVFPSPCPSPTPAPTPRPPDASGSLEVKYVRDSAEYATLTRMVYSLAAQAVERAAAEHEQEHDGRLLAVVLDIDETALDNSVYQLERAAYRLPFSGASWEAWVRRRAAGAVPGAVEFVRAARARGARVAWISNRDDGPASFEATRANLHAWGLWSDGDRLCLQHGDEDRSKAQRRGELRAGGGGRCSFGAPARVAAYVGDQLGDFPRDDEPGAEALRESDFGCRYFLLPDPMYGGWTNAVTRPLP
jgi:acid phosphatase